MLAIYAGILNLGNIKFLHKLDKLNNDDSEIDPKCKENVDLTCKLLGIEEEVLRKILTKDKKKLVDDLIP